MHRRRFLGVGSRAALGCLVLSRGSRAQPAPAPAAPGPGGRWKTLTGDLERLIPGLLEQTVVPGLSIALVRDGTLLWRRGFGVRDNASKTPVDEDTIFEAASVSKTVFAYAVMKLCEKGVLDLDTPLTAYTRKRFLEDDPRLERITARHVLSHSAGFQDWRSAEDPLKIHFTPGESFRYSGEGYSYLQSVVTRLTGRENPAECATYEADLEVCATDIDPCLRRNLFEPFGMISSGYVWNDTLARHAARPHDSQGTPLPKKQPSATDAARYAAAGGLHTTATDYARFLTEVMDPRRSDAFRLNRRSLLEMLRPQVKLKKGQEIDGAGSWALGWAVQERPTGDVIVHSGGQTGFRSLAMASVERKSGFIILTNGDNGARVIHDPRLVELLNPLLTA